MGRTHVQQWETFEAIGEAMMHTLIRYVNHPGTLVVESPCVHV